MRFLTWHVDYFKCRITERGRSPLVEQYDAPETVAAAQGAGPALAVAARPLLQSPGVGRSAIQGRRLLPFWLWQGAGQKYLNSNRR